MLFLGIAMKYVTPMIERKGSDQWVSADVQCTSIFQIFLLKAWSLV